MYGVVADAMVRACVKAPNHPVTRIVLALADKYRRR